MIISRIDSFQLFKGIIIKVKCKFIAMWIDDNWWKIETLLGCADSRSKITIGATFVALFKLKMLKDLGENTIFLG